MLSIEPKGGKTQEKGRRDPLGGRRKRRRRREKTWLEERTDHFDVVEPLVQASFDEGCIQIGPDKTLRLGTTLGSGEFGTVFAATVVEPPLTIDVAAKLMVDRGYHPDSNIFHEAQIAATVSSSVRRGETPHFLLFYGVGYCEDAGVPRWMVSEMALKVQRRKNTAAAYLPKEPRDLLFRGRYHMLDKGLQRVFSCNVWDDEEFLRRLYLYVQKNFPPENIVTPTGWGFFRPEDIVMAPMPTTVPFFVHVMERATYSLVDFIQREDPRTVHDVVGQIFQTVKDFYDITEHIHMDLHAGNTMVIEHESRDVPEYVLVMIDFGLVSTVSPIVSPEAFMISVFLDTLMGELSVISRADALVNAIDGLFDSPDQDVLISSPRGAMHAFEKGPSPLSSLERLAMGMGQMGVELREEGIERVDVEALSDIWASLGPREEPTITSSSTDVFGLL